MRKGVIIVYVCIYLYFTLYVTTEIFFAKKYDNKTVSYSNWI
jgi:hypothetical protein